MVVAASPWQVAHDLPLIAPGSFHRRSPRVTHSIPGLANSSACIALISGLVNSLPSFNAFLGIGGSIAWTIDATEASTTMQKPLHERFQRPAPKVTARERSGLRPA